VVTYRIDYSCGAVVIMEFFRGDFAECNRIYENSSTGSDDMHQTKQPWKAVMGPARDWDRFIEEG